MPSSVLWTWGWRLLYATKRRLGNISPAKSAQCECGYASRVAAAQIVRMNASRPTNKQLPIIKLRIKNGQRALRSPNSLKMISDF
jgi:hypothetical protein